MVFHKKSKNTVTDSNRHRRLGTHRTRDTPSPFSFEIFLNGLLYTIFGIMAVIICFLGLSPASPLVQQGQISRMRVVAEIPFDYASDIETEKRLEAQRQRIPPVYELSMEQYREFKDYLLTVFEAMAEYAIMPEDAPEELIRLKTEEVRDFLRNSEYGNPFGIRAEDLATIYNQLGQERGREIIDEGLILLNEIYQQGIFDAEDAIAESRQDRMSFFNVEDESGNIQEVEIMSEAEALRSLRIHLAAFDIPRDSTIALFRVLRSGVNPNLEFDPQRTRELIESLQENVKPVKINVEAGESIIEPNVRVTPRQFEKLEAYREALQNAQTREFGLDVILLERILLTLLIILGAVLYLRLMRIRIYEQRRVFILSGIVILLNLLINRLLLELGSSNLASTPILLQILPYLIPAALGPIILSIIIGSGPAILGAALVSVFNAMMQGNSLTILILSLLGGMAGIYFCRNIQLRASLVRAGFYAGATMAFGAILIGIRDNIMVSTVFYQAITGLSTGIVSGIVIVGLLPILEQIFRYTTDITLFELTDYNHPLLRKMQVEAPGSYHHSLMVANLSENAAASIGANPLICRVCSLFHDIGKMVKPEYFAENQSSGRNPHIERNPSMSALVIKSHVKEGVQLARKFKLPEIIVEVIQQHHGTSLIQYFYYKALEKQRMETTEAFSPNAPRVELDKVNEDTYRYEGPIPQFTESSVIMLADSVEAASRSLRKVNSQSVEELVDNIVTARMEDGQLDATPITFRQLAKIKESFSFTLLNMLHARVEYPEEAKESERRSRKKISQKRGTSSPALPENQTNTPDSDENNPPPSENGNPNNHNS